MKKKQVDDTEYPDGPWQDEPDWARWEDDITGLPCLIRRNPSIGNLCGYVGVPEDHPLHGVDYSQCIYIAHGRECPDPEQEEWGYCDHEPQSLIDVHGGVTFAGEHPDDSEKDGPEWWVGFDCAHLGDVCPGMDVGQSRGTYRRFRYVRGETEGLARQLVAIDTVAKAEADQ